MLATEGTHARGMYHEYFKVSDGFTLIEPEPSMRERIHDAIYNEVYEIKDSTGWANGPSEAQLVSVFAFLLLRSASFFSMASRTEVISARIGLISGASRSMPL